MGTFRSNLPLGTSDATVFVEGNVPNLDEAMNSSQLTWANRFGVESLTYKGVISRFDSQLNSQESLFTGFIDESSETFLRFLESSGYSGGDRPYAAGILLNAHNEGFVRCEPDGTACLFYTPRSDTPLPYTTTGDWATESGLFVVRGDDSLRQDLADPEKGAALVVRSTISVNSVEDLSTIDIESLSGFSMFVVKSYYGDDGPGGGLFYYDEDKKHINNRGTIINGFVRLLGDEITPFMFGFSGGDSTIDSSAIKESIEHASDLNLKWSARNINIELSAPLELSPPKSVEWEIESCFFDFKLNTDTDVGFKVNLKDGYSHKVTGDFSCNFNGRSNTGIMFLNPSIGRDTSISIDGIKSNGVEMQVGIGVASSGICIRGGFDLVRINDCHASDIKIRTGAGSLGNNGVTGILVTNHFGTTGAYARRTEISGGSIVDVYAEDGVYQYDMDGIGIFANPLDTSQGPSSCVIDSVYFENCWGRSVKTQTGRTSIINPRIRLTTAPADGVINPILDSQSGGGIISGVRAYLEGVRVNTLAAFQVETHSQQSIGIFDNSEIVIAQNAFLREVLFVSPLSSSRAIRGICRSIAVAGSVQNFARVGASSFDAHSVSINDCTAENIGQSVVHALSVGGGSAPYRAVVDVQNFYNMGNQVPLIFSNDAGQSVRVRASSGGVLLGVSPATDVTDTKQGAIGSYISLTGPEKAETVDFISGTRRLISTFLEPNATYLSPAHGHGCVKASITMGAFRTTSCVLFYDADGIDIVFAGVNTKIGQTSEPSNDLLKVWVHNGNLAIKNGSTAPRVITIELIG